MCGQLQTVSEPDSPGIVQTSCVKAVQFSESYWSPPFMSFVSSWFCPGWISECHVLSFCRHTAPCRRSWYHLDGGFCASRSTGILLWSPQPFGTQLRFFYQVSVATSNPQTQSHKQTLPQWPLTSADWLWPHSVCHMFTSLQSVWALCFFFFFVLKH